MSDSKTLSKNSGITYNDRNAELSDKEDLTGRVAPVKQPAIWDDPEKCAQTRRARKTLKEIAQIIGNEWVDYVTDDGKTMTIPRNAVVLYRFYESAIKRPTAQKIIALQKILGEDVFRIGGPLDTEHKGSTKELIGQLNTLITAIKSRAHTIEDPSTGAKAATAVDYVPYDVIDEQPE